MPRQTLKQRQDGRYKVKYKGIQFYGKTQKEAQEKRDAYKRAEAAGAVLHQRGVLTGEYCLRWLKTYKPNVTPAVLDAYKRHIRRFCTFAPESVQLGDLPLVDVTASDVQAFFGSCPVCPSPLSALIPAP